MMKKKYRILMTMTPLAALLLVIAAAACSEKPKDWRAVNRLPKICPDYIGVTVPAGIAPLNFNLAPSSSQTKPDRIYVVAKGSKGGELTTSGGYADFDIDRWHELTSRNKGGEITVTVYAKTGGAWTRYKPFTIAVSDYPLDEWGLTYRLIAPGYEVYSHMGLYQRDLSNFNEYAIIENTQAVGQCVNCHTPNRTNPDQFVFHVRGDHGATMIQLGGRREWLAARNDSLKGSMVYPYWHPGGRYCAFSTNQTRQGFHTLSNDRIEVFDLSSDVFVYDTREHQLILDTLLMTKDYSENTPVFSPDGKTLYFMTCLARDYPLEYDKEKYCLCRIGFDAETGTFDDKVDTIFNAPAMGKSMTWPKPSYDGKYILFTMLDYGYFAIWHNESRQWLLDLRSLEARPITEIEGPHADSYHNWNVNSHWVVFTSRRDDALYTRLYLTSVDDNGHFTKPFLLPQRCPKDYYDALLYSYNVPDFTSREVDFDAYDAAREIKSDRRVQTTVR